MRILSTSRRDRVLSHWGGSLDKASNVPGPVNMGTGFLVTQILIQGLATDPQLACDQSFFLAVGDASFECGGFIG